MHGNKKITKHNLNANHNAKNYKSQHEQKS